MRSELSRLAAADCLGNIQNDQAYSALVQQLETEVDEDVIIAIVRALRAHGVTSFDFINRTDINRLVNSVRTEPAVVSLIGMLDVQAQTILEAQNMTRDEYIAYLAWKNNTVEEEIEPVYRGYQYEVDTSNKMHGAFKTRLTSEARKALTR